MKLFVTYLFSFSKLIRRTLPVESKNDEFVVVVVVVVVVKINI